MALACALVPHCSAVANVRVGVGEMQVNERPGASSATFPGGGSRWEMAVSTQQQIGRNNMWSGAAALHRAGGREPVFHRTLLVTVSPRFVIVNRVGSLLEVGQQHQVIPLPDALSALSVEDGRNSPLAWPSAAAGAFACFRVPGYDWSGAVDVRAVGDSAVCVRRTLVSSVSTYSELPTAGASKRLTYHVLRRVAVCSPLSLYGTPFCTRSQACGRCVSTSGCSEPLHSVEGDCGGAPTVRLRHRHRPQGRGGVHRALPCVPHRQRQRRRDRGSAGECSSC